MKTDVQVYGLMVEFLTPEAVLKATREARLAGFRDMDAFTPYAVKGLAEELGMRRSRFRRLCCSAAWWERPSVSACSITTMAIDYPFNSGGRPYNSWPAFIPITFEMLILVAR